MRKVKEMVVFDLGLGDPVRVPPVERGRKQYRKGVEMIPGA